ncbi:MAG TPA: FKBP-type peptidyl-prolyl cis-trans isomerase [Gammaproteobacteria bacterium]
MNKGLPIALAGLLGLMFAVPIQAEQTGNLPETVEKAAEAQKEAQDDPRNRHEKRGDAYLEQGLVNEAINAFDAAIADDPKADTAYVKKGIALFRTGKFEEAIEMMDKAMKVTERDKTWRWWPIYHKGVVQASSGDMKAALKSFNRSIKLNPNSENYQARARTYAQMGKLDKAIADARTALEFKPDDYPLTAFVSRMEAYVRTRKESEAFLKEMATRDGARKTKSGLVYLEEKKGDGETPAAGDTVTVHYHGTLIEGKVFDSSIRRGEPASLKLNETIPCWIEALQLMRVGGKAKLICPAELAYGDRGVGSLIKPGAAIVFDVELLGVERTEESKQGGST